MMKMMTKQRGHPYSIAGGTIHNQSECSLGEYPGDGTADRFVSRYTLTLHTSARVRYRIGLGAGEVSVRVTKNTNLDRIQASAISRATSMVELPDSKAYC